MSHRSVKVPVLLLVLLVANCCQPLDAAAPAKRPADPPKKIEITDDVLAVAAKSNAFACDLYAQLCQQNGNLFYSPASISTALAMAYAGSAGKTHDQLAQVLHFELADDRLHAGFGTLGLILNSGNKNYRLQMANRLWGAKNYPFSPEFLSATRTHYGAGLTQLNFVQAETARQTINGWIEQQTNGKIRDLVPPGAVDADTRLVLTNAIYFKGAWQDEFWKNATQPAVFHRSKTDETKVPMMHRSGHFGYGETKDLQLLNLPYAGGDLSMIVLLPKPIDGLDHLERQLTAKNLGDWTAAAGERLVQVYLPKFKLTSDFQLGPALRSLGMNLAFSREADFSRMSSVEGLLLSDVIHKAFVDVSEEGTEAAAATAVPPAPSAAPVGEPEKPVVFRADHPFVFLIRDNRTQALLFLGRLVSPSAGA
ncbi:MAG TPA: serpin family protein [Pirellulales bacterium]|nr:serpin family protein [Pirellulales bacterium]